MNVGVCLMRKAICIVCCIFLIFSTFSVTAFGLDEYDSDTYPEPDLTFFDFLQSYYGSAFYQSSIADDPDKLVDFYSTNPGKLLTLRNLFMITHDIPITIITAHNIQSAVDSRYITAKVSKDFIDQFYLDTQNMVEAEFRYITLDEIGISISAENTINNSLFSVFGDPFVVDSSLDLSSCGYITNNSALTSNGVYFFCGSSSCPAFFYINGSNYVTHWGNQLENNRLYIILDTHTLLQFDQYSFPPMIFWFQDYGELEEGILNFSFLRRGDNGLVYRPLEIQRSQGSSLVVNGVNTSKSSTSYTTDWLIYDMLLKQRGHLLTVDESVSPTVTVPDDEDIPYDDNDTVYVLAPVDQVGDVIYMSPTEYNNYVTNGNIYNSDDHSSNTYSHDVSNQLYNIYNNYITNNGDESGSSYNDANLMSKLDIIITKLDRINKSIQDLDLNVIVNPEPSYEDFSDVTASVPLIAEVRQLILDFQEVLEDPIEVPHIDFELFGVEDSISFEWYLPYQSWIKDLLRAFFYICGVISCWLSLKSAFGVHRGEE